MGTADLHIHTALGDGMAEIPELLSYVEEQTELSVIAITEHDSLRPALAAREAWARDRHRFELIVGEEVTTIEGHLLALFIEEPVPSLQRLLPTLEAVHRQGGLCIIPHPMSWLTRSVGRRMIERVLREKGDGIQFDGMETASSPAARFSGGKARQLNRERFHLPEIGASDAHFLQAIGASHTVFEGSTADALRNAIVASATRAVAGRYPSMLELGILNVARQQWRGLMATPRQLGWLPTISSFVKRALP